MNGGIYVRYHFEELIIKNVTDPRNLQNFDHCFIYFHLWFYFEDYGKYMFY